MPAFRLDILQEDIDTARKEILYNNGLPSQCCPMVRAARRAGWLRASGAHQYLTLVDGQFNMPYIAVQTTEELSAWVRAFDAKNPVEPASFTLDVPDTVFLYRTPQE